MALVERGTVITSEIDVRYRALVQKSLQRATYSPHPLDAGTLLIHFGDPTHILKNCRNHFDASSTAGSRKMVKVVKNSDGSFHLYDISMSHVREAHQYSQQHHSSCTTPLTFTALNLTAWSKMSVAPLRALFHPRTVALLRCVQRDAGDTVFSSDPTATIEFLDDMHLLLTCMFSPGLGHKYCTVQDRRLLQCVAIIEKMEAQRRLIQEYAAANGIRPADAELLHLPRETFDALVKCVFGFVLLVYHLTSADAGRGGTSQALTTPLRLSWPNNDHIEHHFGNLRQSSSETNPTALRVQQTTKIGVKRYISAKLVGKDDRQRKSTAGDHSFTPDLPPPVPNARRKLLAGDLQAGRARSASEPGSEEGEDSESENIGDSRPRVPLPAPTGCGSYRFAWPLTVSPQPTRQIASGVDESEVALNPGGDRPAAPPCAPPAPVATPLPPVLNGAVGATAEVVSAVLLRFRNAPGPKASQLLEEFLSIPAGALKQFIEAVRKNVNFDLARRSGGGQLEWGGATWSGRMQEAYTAFMQAFFPATQRRECWQQCTGHNSELSPLLSLFVFHDTLSVILAHPSLSPSPDAPPSTQGAVEAYWYSAQFQERHADTFHEGTVEALLLECEADLPTLHDEFQTANLAYVAGWDVYGLRKVRQFCKPRYHASGRTLPAGVRAADVDQAAQAIVRDLDTTVGPYVAKSVRLGPQQRLTVVTEAFKRFMLQLEWYIHKKLLTPANTRKHLGNVIVWCAQKLSESAFIRRCWEGVFTTKPTSPVEEIARVCVLERAVERYMLSRQKTFRRTTSLLPEASSNTALRTGRKVAGAQAMRKDKKRTKPPPAAAPPSAATPGPAALASAPGPPLKRRGRPARSLPRVATVGERVPPSPPPGAVAAQVPQAPPVPPVPVPPPARVQAASTRQRAAAPGPTSGPIGAIIGPRVAAQPTPAPPVPQLAQQHLTCRHSDRKRKLTSFPDCL
ncbi:hypothetical protein [Silvimonas sp.]|uniref:hypothetical protein n=1 Tax=Silvimonas sp. TaxID=2650811 RepID=UPI0028469365|nr:hypothetical protein [Silvimonas sp.]MDR3426688.1 hypothetical protein [Silvimonas sp.]